MEKWKGIIFKFSVHVLIGSSAFVIILIPAVALDLIVNILTVWSIDPIVIWILKFTKYGILAIDVSLLLIFLIRIGWHTLRDI